MPNQVSVSSGRLFPAGLYSLTDGVVGDNSITTWQWYLLRGGVQVNQPDRKVDKFSTDSPILLDGDEIVWRLVVVATRPKIPADKSAFSNKVDRLPKT